MGCDAYETDVHVLDFDLLPSAFPPDEVAGVVNCTWIVRAASRRCFLR